MHSYHRISPLLLLVLAGGPQGACANAPTGSVQPGIEVLLADSLQLIRGRRVGLLTNQAGVDRAGVDDVRRLRAAGVTLTAIFSPEHGFRGVLDQENIRHGVDSATGLPIFSLYGQDSMPTPEMLADVDVLLVDLPDVGARPYTYVSTVLLTLGAAGRAHVPVIVLDRPNPLGGRLVQGPVLDTAFRSFNGMLAIPLRHGMTMGELVRFGRVTLDIRADLVVIPMRGWRRAMWFDETGLPWVRPSLNLPTLDGVTHYPGLVLFEATNLSVGRGTPVAFGVLAAPWLDPRAVVERLRDEPGVGLRDTTVTPVNPSDGKYPGRPLPAIRFRVMDRAHYDPVHLAVRLLADLRAAHGDSLRVNARRMAVLAGTDLWGALQQGRTAEEIARAWAAPIERFRTRRRAYLLYPELP